MKNLFKITTRVLAAIAVCAALSACGQANVGNFPSYAGGAGTFVAPTIMDY